MGRNEKSCEVCVSSVKQYTNKWELFYSKCTGLAVNFLLTHSTPYHPATVTINAPTIAIPMYSDCSPAFAQALHHRPASPPPSSASAASLHFLQFSPINPMIVMRDILSNNLDWSSQGAGAYANATTILVKVRIMLRPDIAFAFFASRWTL